MLLFLGTQCQSSLDDKSPFTGAKALLDVLYVFSVCF